MTIKAILQELRDWRGAPTRRDAIRRRPLDKEYPDPRPMAVPVGYETPPTMTELIQLYVRQEVSQQASADNMGTFDEEDDFSDDDPESLPVSQYEVNEYEMSEDPDMLATLGDPPDSNLEDRLSSPPGDPPAEAGNEDAQPTEKP